MYRKLVYYNKTNNDAPVAQLDRASVYGTVIEYVSSGLAKG